MSLSHSTELAQAWLKERATEFTGQLLFDEPLFKHTYYRIGGPASVLVIPRTHEDLLLIAKVIEETGVPHFFLGAGSNLLVGDAGYGGLVIKAARLNLNIDLLSEDRLRTGASVAISTLMRRVSQEGWGGLEFLTGVPGSVGGAIAMNAGTHLGETKDRAKKVEVVSLLKNASGTVSQFVGDELKFEYRKNLFLPEAALITSVEWEIKKQDPAQVKALIDETLARRKATQPVDYPSCGSVFKNPKAHGMHAWQVIDRLGLRGHRIGDAQFADKHPNFIINHGHARASEVRTLIQLAKARAQAELGIGLEEEVKYLGVD